jgi:hypothetical protein
LKNNKIPFFYYILKEERNGRDRRGRERIG